MHEELRALQTRLRETEDKLRHSEKSSRNDSQARLLEKKAKLEQIEDDLKYGLMPPQMLNMEYRLQEALRANQILSKSRDALAKTV
jgi:predicted RNA binding protein with dsRBD fold (UPF0201 family)